MLIDDFEANAEVRVFDMVKKIVTRANCLMFFGEQFCK